VTSEGYTTTPMPRWEQAGTPRRVCAVMGAVIAVLGFAQLGLTIALFTFLAAYLQLYDQEAAPAATWPHGRVSATSSLPRSR
jgi:hypothetical protein